MLLVRRTARQGRRVPLCFQEILLSSSFFSLSTFFPYPRISSFSLFFPFSSACTHTHTHSSPSLIDHSSLQSWGGQKLMKTRLLATVSLFLICRSKAVLHDPPQVYFKYICVCIHIYIYTHTYLLFIYLTGQGLIAALGTFDLCYGMRILVP